MSCQDIVLCLPERARGELSGRRAAEIEAHLRGCAACAAEAASLEALTRMLRANPPAPPSSMSFQMMGDRVWAELEAGRRRRRIFFGLFGLAATAALALLLVWPGARAPEPARPPAVAVVEEPNEEPEELDPSERAEPFAELAEPEEIDELDEATAELLDRNLFAAPPTKEDVPFLGDDTEAYLEALEELSPAELERLEALLAQKTKG